MESLLLKLDAFVRSVGIKKNYPHALFLGAGASVSSGIPSAEMCIWEWKRDIFLTNNPGLEDQFSEISLPIIRERIQKWLDRQGKYPDLVSPDEYSFYIENCYPISADRRAYFKNKVKFAKPSIGYELMCLLAESEIVKSIWTTNFDGLAQKVASKYNIIPLEVGIDSQNRLPIHAQRGELLCVSLHGDYRYDKLKNTSDELKEQEKHLRQAMVDQFKDTSLIVCGYSGRDRSVMSALSDAYSVKGTGALYWCGYGQDITSNVKNIIEKARSNGRSAYFIPAEGFDDLMIRLSLHCLKGEQLRKVKSMIAGPVNILSLRKEPLNLEVLPITGLIKSNAFETECPSEVFEFDLKKWPEKNVWGWLRSITNDRKIIAVPFRKVLSLGLEDDIKETFRDFISGAIRRVPISDNDLRIEDGAVTSLMRQALVSSMAEMANLNTDSRYILWEKKCYKRKREEDHNCLLFQAVVVYLRKIKNKIYVFLKPSIAIEEETGKTLPLNVVNNLKLRELSGQYNKQFNKAINHWRNLLFRKKPVTVFEYPSDSGSNFRFKVRYSPIFASIGSKGIGKQINLDNKIRPHIKQYGIQLDEPKLIFSDYQADRYVKDTHPLRGLVQNRPHDFSLTQRGLSSKVTIGVVCPGPESKKFESYLYNSSACFKPKPTEQDYLIQFNGFKEAFGLPMEVPQVDGPGWISYPEVNKNLDQKKGALELSDHIIKSIGSIEANYKPNIVVIFIPQRLQKWTRFETEIERFDLHDFVKAYSVQRGIATQFIEEKTLSYDSQCRIWWWLSLALYAKSMRTPWVLDSLDEDTAFVGLGFSIDEKAERGKHVVLGCSHLYNSQGQGLQFRLSKIENPIIVNKNPFMKQEDARQVGETIRRLFYESRTKLPNRVVIHRLTHFRNEEIKGLREGLNGVKIVDMIEISEDSAMRYVSSVPKKGGGFDEDNYPVKRGTIVHLDDFTALLWVHGVTEAVQSGRRYYQGKRRIPAPVVLKRHAGESELSLLAKEILGLSKMDWNSADLYSKLPATVHSSKQIARIGFLLQRFGPISYDYRLFI